MTTAPNTGATTSRLLGISLAYFLVLLDTTVLTVALPDLRASTGGTLAEQQWVVDAYTVTFAAFLLGGGAAADRLGAARVFRWGVAAFGLLSLASAAAPTASVLVGLRALLGVAAAACLPSSLALITQLYPDPARRARALGTWAATTGVALVAGPLAGGLLVDVGGWRAVFLVNVPLAALSLAMTTREGRIGPVPGRVDWRPQLAACLVLASVTEGVVAAQPLAVVPAVIGALLFVRWERRSEVPTVPPELLRAPQVVSGLVAGAAINFVLAGVLFTTTLLLQDEHHLTPMLAGLAFLPLTLPTAAGPVFTARIVAARGPRLPVLVGLVLLTAGAGLLAAWPAALYPLLAAGLLLIGTGVSLTLPALVTVVVAAAPHGTAGTASGLLNAVRQTGATVGVAVMGALTGGPAFLSAVLVSGAAVLLWVLSWRRG
ncbi:MFS transporter [Pseudonocardia sp. DSM 110487]|uniref:MFS transporter n=1 Tax=Pseudonocardia sp. DSM 110487 TaxID=2865833 RepID=UPI001C6971A0|nr:MFS transporter [Pseudonocardia sp. DSM 110487]QYN34440.1 MFS transporter [Pseudonocardia sp. DSM 110487]